MGIFDRRTKRNRNEYKICVLGDDEVGKTSLIRRYTENEFEEDYTKRNLISKKDELYVSVEENGLPRSDVIGLNIWDLANDMTMKQSYINTKGALLVCNMTEKIPLHSLEYWKNELYKVAGEVPIVVVGNKIDLKKDIETDKEDLEKAAKKLGAPCIMTSAKSGENVKAAFDKLAKMLI